MSALQQATALLGATNRDATTIPPVLIRRNTSTLNDTFTGDRRFTSSFVSSDARRGKDSARTCDSEWSHGTAAPVLSALGLTDFAYVRWLGDRKGIEKQTTTWDKTVIDRTNDLENWVEVFKSLASNSKVLKIFAFSNNHYAGHGPATAKLFWDLWNKRQ